MSSRYEYAGFWIRFGAAILDTLIIGIPMTIVTSMLFGVSENPVEFSTGDVVSNVLWLVIVIACWIKLAATPGKLILKLKVLDAKTGEYPTIGQAILRYIGYIPSALAFCIGLIWVGFDKQKQGWHDKIAGTVVVKDHDA